MLCAWYGTGVVGDTEDYETPPPQLKELTERP